MKNILTLILFLAILFVPHVVVKADTSATSTPTTDSTNSTSQSALGIQPAIVEVVLDKDKPTQQEVNLFNLTNVALPIKTIKGSFSIQDKADVPADKLRIYDSSSWITMSDQDTDFILQPKSKKTVTLNITQPEDASPGGHYATIYFQPLVPAELVSQQSVFVYARIAVLVFMQTRGDIVENIEIKSIDSLKVSESSEINLSLTLENKGNTHLLPTGKVDIYDDLTGNIISTQQINNSLVLPGLEKTFTFEVDPKYLIGKLSAQATIVYGAENIVVKSPKVVTFIFPYKLVGLILILLFSIIFLRKRMIKAGRVLFHGDNNNKDIKLNTSIKPERKLLKRVIS